VNNNYYFKIKKITDIEDFLIWMAEEYGTAVTTVSDTKMWAEGTLDAFYKVRDHIEILGRENKLLKEKMERLCSHKNLEDRIYTSNPPKKKCLDCGGFLNV